MADPRVEDLEVEITAWSWERFDELRRSGTLTLMDGTVLRPGEPGFEEILRVIQYQAKRRPARARRVPEPSDFVAQSTRRVAAVIAENNGTASASS
jgi:hypothetical protein